MPRGPEDSYFSETLVDNYYNSNKPKIINEVNISEVNNINDQDIFHSYIESDYFVRNFGV